MVEHIEYLKIVDIDWGKYEIRDKKLIDKYLKMVKMDVYLIDPDQREEFENKFLEMAESIFAKYGIKSDDEIEEFAENNPKAFKDMCDEILKTLENLAKKYAKRTEPRFLEDAIRVYEQIEGKMVRGVILTNRISVDIPEQNIDWLGLAKWKHKKYSVIVEYYPLLPPESEEVFYYE